MDSSSQTRVEDEPATEKCGEKGAIRDNQHQQESVQKRGEECTINNTQNLIQITDENSVAPITMYQQRLPEGADKCYV